MKAEVNKIYRWGNALVRIADVKGNTVTFSNGGIGDISDIHPALPVGTLLQTSGYPTRSISVESEIEYIDENTMVGDFKLFDSAGNERFRSHVFPDNKGVDGLLTMVKEFLENERYTTSDLALAKILGEWKRNKARLRKTLSLSPAWDEKSMALVFNIEVPDMMKKKTANEIFEGILNRYRCDFHDDWNHAVRFCFDDFFDIDDNKKFKDVNIKIAQGMRPARAIRRYFEAIGVHRIVDFEKLYAQLSDALSDRPIKRTLTLSIHPMDYLRMSYGNSWQSCHHIGERGCYHNGTLSYLMDEDAMVATLLPVEFEGATYMQPKINRMMFFLNEEGDILQSRLYPQTRIPELEKVLAKEVAAKIQEALDIEGAYKAIVSDIDCNDYVWSLGNHYHDYNCDNYGQNIWSVKDKPAPFKIGHPGVCVTSGELNASNNTLSCCGARKTMAINYTCPNSGAEFRNKDFAKLNPADGKYYQEYYVCPECGAIHFDKNEVYCPECRKTHKMVCGCGSEEIYIVVNGRAYCKECAFKEFSFCEDCGALERRYNLHEFDERYLCDDCMERNGDYERCEDCGEYHDRDNMYYVENYGWVCEYCYNDGPYYTCDHCGDCYREDDIERVGGNYVCPSCLDEYYYRCDRCDEYVYQEDAEWVGDECYCSDCIEEHFVRCESCGDYVDIDDAYEVNGCYYCDECFDDKFAECADCGTIYEKSEMRETEDGLVCEDCYNEREQQNEEDTEERVGILNRTLDGRFTEGIQVTIDKEYEDSYRIKIGVRDIAYRIVEKSDITQLEQVSA